MSFRSSVTRLFEARRALRSLDRLVVAEERIADALDRLAARFGAGVDVEASPEDLRTTGISVSRDREQALLQDWADRFLRLNGREPTDEELAEAADGFPVQ